jgi:iron complex transport system ATP-binding protein
VVLDEPTNHLDVRAQLDLLALVRDLGVTVLAALHDLDQAASHADRVAVLDRGRIVETGLPEAVLTPRLIEQVFGVRAHVGPHPLTGRPHIAVAPADRVPTPVVTSLPAWRRT